MDVKVHGMLYSAQTFEYLVWALESASPASCKTPATSIDSICPNKHPRNKHKFLKKKKKKKIKLPTNHIVLSWAMYREPRATRGRLGT